MDDDPNPEDKDSSIEDDLLGNDEILANDHDMGVSLEDVPVELRVYAKKYPNPQLLQSQMAYIRKLKRRYESGHPELEMWINASEGLFMLEKWYVAADVTFVRV